MVEGICGVVQISLLTRGIALVLQLTFSNVISDYDSSLWQNRQTSKPLDTFVDVSLHGFTHWDSVYFLRIAESGYEYEQFMAFFPLYPLVMRVLAMPINWALGSFISLTRILIIIGWLLSCVCFITASIMLHQLTLLKFKNKSIALFTSCIFCINPANVFMNGLYSESLFVCCLFTGLYIIETSRDFKNTMFASVLFGLASGTRSNGIITCGFVLHFLLKRLLTSISEKQSTWMNKISTILSSTVVFIISTVIITVPFVVFEYYGYSQYCKRTGQLSPSWCKKIIPFSYSYIQDHYWNVGFLRYFQVKQIPNFMLATPMILLCLASVIEYCQSNYIVSIVTNLGLIEGKKSVVQLSIGGKAYHSSDMFVYIVHLSFLTVFGVSCVHVQVITRMIASSSPVIYWYTAYLVVKGNAPQTTKTVLAYFLCYFIVGIILHCNFYPWT